MEIFLQHIARQVYEAYPDSLDRVWMVFPGRRSAQYFSRFLGGMIKKTSWMPRMLTISELFREYSEYLPADRLFSVIRLYGVYRNIHPAPESFDAFFPWGEMVLNDFDEVDKYLADPHDLFRNVRSLREIDEHFAYLTEEQREAVRWFWDALPEDRKSGNSESFLRMWNLLPGLYDGLRETLRSEGFGYDGMIYRGVAEKADRGEDLPCDARRVCFVGFAALNACEKKLLAGFRNRGLADFYWDYDTWYTGDVQQEAGFFLRQNLQEFPPKSMDMDFSVLNRPGREIRVIETSSRMEEARMLGHILNETSGEAGDDPNHTAVVLADESMLLPVMYSIPSHVKEINVTMGYPLKDAPVYPLLNSLFRLARGVRGEGQGRRFDARDVVDLLSQQMVKDLDAGAAGELTADIFRSNRLFVETNRLEKHESLGFLFAVPGDIHEVSRWLQDILYRFFVHSSAEGREEEHRMTREFIYHVYEAIGKLQELISSENVNPAFSTYLSLLRRYLYPVRIPFSGEPLAGLQVMGLMETRSLDFRNVILLSAGEGFLPRTTARGSFIPHNLRVGFGLPVTAHQDSIFAYYFYRLLQRAENVWLVYTGVDRGMVTGEASRFIHQLRYDSQIRIADIRPSPPAVSTVSVPVTIPKTREVYSLLEQYLDGAEKQIALSPTALNAYLDCPMRFYYRYLAGITEEKTFTGQVDEAAFGSLLHHTMKYLYEEKCGEEVQAGWLEALQHDENRVEEALSRAFREVWFKHAGGGEPEGNLFLVKEVIREYADRIMALDRRTAPFLMLALEKPYYMDFSFLRNGEDRKVRIGGTIDRLDEKAGKVRVLDYKTGKVNLEFRGVGSLFQRGQPSRNGMAFQTILYSLVYRNSLPEEKTVTPGLLFLRNIYREGFDTRLVDVNAKSPLVNVAVVQEAFEENLRELLQELFDPHRPFTLTGDQKICDYCACRPICGRE
ncbi:MAG TPA: PD-(D/E)XK nuclease family protein [Bacteroidetes bacterium]|nr:PD-(D/E)XK nuclease family protein [Bacteroidota bacterium]